jgi:hypothetical protein
MPKTDVTLDWHGDEIERRFRRALGRATIAVGEGVSNEAKRQVHVQSGDLRRSIHAAAGSNVEGEPGASEENIKTTEGSLLEVGSWLDYACVEEVGRMHQYMHPAVGIISKTAHLTFVEAFKQEGF